MKIYISLTIESFWFAWQALRSNILRTALSLLGVTVGIFAIISVFTLVDSLENNIRQSMSFLGEKVLYVQKWPWVFGSNYPWWKYMNRPYGTYQEFKFLDKNVKYTGGVAIFASKGEIKFETNYNHIDAALMGASFGYNQVADVSLEQGRYFTRTETEQAAPLMLIGASVAETLFPNSNNLIGQIIRVRGKRFTVIGVMKRQGTNLLGMPSNDKNCVIPYLLFTRMISTRRPGVEPIIAAKALANDADLAMLDNELRSLMRGKRGLKPRQEDSFSINRPEMVANAITSIFTVLGLAGGIIGSFAILVGGFGIANIMFVSVRERTSLIGIQKALGAKNYFILLQFLFEAVFLSLFGGIAGIGLVFLITLIPQDAMPIFMSLKNVTFGIVLSGIIGLIAGIAPAWMAARLSPVEAIRTPA